MKYVKKPVVVEAVQWTGEVTDELAALLDGPSSWYEARWYVKGDYLWFQAELMSNAPRGWWITRHPIDGLSALRPDIFAATYEPAPAEPNPDYDHERAMGRESARRSAP